VIAIGVVMLIIGGGLVLVARSVLAGRHSP
jgi:hypothetical protein